MVCVFPKYGDAYAIPIQRCTCKNLENGRRLTGIEAVDFYCLSDIVSDMKVSTRSLVRNFRKVKAAARKGQTIEIRDGRTGEAFLLTAKPTQTFGELARAAKGVYAGPRRLSSREGFDA